ncbi:hypothetical protein WMY93_023276 [Mugilogobius chulae]|uniref:Uncharacterized protein n=1 Tax=Mugilogobius chulae TaxID=88201 RepID=A0AAW0N3V4_9GOBI
MDRSAESSLPGIPTIRRGSSDNTLDLDSDGGGDRSSSGCEVQRSRSCLDNLQQKILKVTEQLKIEQTARDENVAEYLKLVNSADKQQMSRIKQVFEKKNQKSSQKYRADAEEAGTVSQKDEGYRSPATFARANVQAQHHPERVFQRAFEGHYRKPREFANLIRNKFGSADNIDHLKSPGDSASPLPTDGASKGLSSSTSMVGKSKYPSDDECSSGQERFFFGQQWKYTGGRHGGCREGVNGQRSSRQGFVER